MMDWMRQWALTLCITAVAGAMAQMLLPKGNVQKVCRIVLSVFFLCCMVSPFASGNSGPSGTLQRKNEAVVSRSVENLEQDTQQAVLDQLEGRVEQSLQEGLCAQGIIPVQIQVTMNTERTDQIYINKLTVILPQSQQTSAPKVREYVKGQALVEPQIRYVSDSE